MADQSILKSAVLPASPMPLFDKSEEETWPDQKKDNNKYKNKDNYKDNDKDKDNDNDKDNDKEKDKDKDKDNVQLLEEQVLSCATPCKQKWATHHSA